VPADDGSESGEGQSASSAVDGTHDRQQLTCEAAELNRPGKWSSILLATGSLTAQKSMHSLSHSVQLFLTVLWLNFLAVAGAWPTTRRRRWTWSRTSLCCLRPILCCIVALCCCKLV